jgi:uroporphyrin-3 C-methyltransferase
LIKFGGITVIEKTKPVPEQSIDDAQERQAIVAPTDSSKVKRPIATLYRTLRNVLLLSLIIGALSVGWLVWKEWQQQSVLFEQTSTTVNSLVGSYKNARSQMQAILNVQPEQKQLIGQLEHQVESLQHRVNIQARRLAELGSTTRSDWLLAETEHLIRLAMQRLQTERNTKSPLALLENVDAILKELDDPDMHLVRRAVAADITALRLAGDIDREGIYLELQALGNSIANLSVIDAPVSFVSEPDQLQQTSGSGIGSNIFKEFIGEMGALIRVRQRQTPIEPMVDVSEELIVRRNLQMMIEQSQIALLREEQEIYRHSLLKAHNYLASFFAYNSNAQVLQQRLEALADINIIQELPQINHAFEALQALLIVRQQSISDRPVEGETAP